MKIFKHTFSEPDMWRGWLKNGQSVEVSRSRYGWDFGLGIHIHSNDDDRGGRMLFVKFWRWNVVIPLGVIDHPWQRFEAPQWSAYASNEFGLSFRWGLRGKSFNWPWNWHTLAYEEQLPDGSWQGVISRLGDSERPPAYAEAAPYRYVLKSGEVQDRTATVSKRRHVLTYTGTKRIGWPKWVRESIEIKFDGEVGERSGSWKGGCIGSSYGLHPGETMIAALRRMERERKF